MKRFSMILFLALLLAACQTNKKQPEILFKLPDGLKECSGIAYDRHYNLIWAVADGGNKNMLYGFDSKGGNIKNIGLDVKNNDWEDLTMDTAGNIYIGDFGNNDNKRTDLAIYKITHSILQKGPKIIGLTKFAYPEQKEFPPRKKELFYDCEAFFEHDGFFYLFTKNRSKGFDGTTFLYQVPNQNGFHQAKLIGKYATCRDYRHCAITGAAISPDRSKVVLLSHSKIWLLEDFSGNRFFEGKITELDLNHFSQKEAISFLDNDTLLITDEKIKKKGGNLYRVSLSGLKSKP